MIPLVRPDIPAPHEWLPYYETSRSVGQLSNFGPSERLATERLQALTGRHVVLTSSGTASLQAIIASYASPFTRTQIGVPDFTFAATVLAIKMAGHDPVIIPCDANGLPKAEYLERNDAPLAFVVTAPFGCDPLFERFDMIAAARRRRVFYDCAGGWGLDFKRTVNPVAISFHATKNLPIGEGGAVFLDSSMAANIARGVINFGGAWGFNGKMSEVHAAILCAQLEPRNLLRAEQRLAHRKTVIAAYAERCRRLRPFSYGAPSLCAFIDTEHNVQGIIDACARKDIAAKRGYWPLIAGHEATAPELEHVVALPSAVTLDEVAHITDVINKGV